MGAGEAAEEDVHATVHLVARLRAQQIAARKFPVVRQASNEEWPSRVLGSPYLRLDHPGRMERVSLEDPARVLLLLEARICMQRQKRSSGPGCWRLWSAGCGDSDPV